MKRQTINTNYLETIDWLNGTIFDWASAGKIYYPDGQQGQVGQYHYSLDFDGSITSTDGQYAFIYQRLGTKGLLLKNGVLLREINRSYYCADTYEYPAAFVTVNNTTYLIHCPNDYCQLDFEEVETGNIVTAIEGRKPSDVFHSRLSISPNGDYLMVCGWVWHPVELVDLFDIAECLKNPLLLDKTFSHNFGIEIYSASFIDNEHILVASSDGELFDDEVPPILPPKHIAVWNFKNNELSKPVEVDNTTGNFFAINSRLAWDTYKFPKLIDIETGEIMDKLESVNSGIQSSSIYTNATNCPQIRFDRQSGIIAIKISSTIIEVLSVK
ncbi:hypothetical protein FMM05_18140 [Flavobacterium zepuense]|uniref:Uncharacterized protein n=1 Tax=Flavobacterium zepuense TaxID=2593302 RepID=A0A552UW05_9FLAO|nr:hypothetical protein [Flavobacterium zepuense]TRW22424.1 hypothetical protein FMM05_18140 [Flavobacterium zepuense]